MIGLVLVSHSEPLATATAELALQMAGENPPPVRVAAGSDGAFGTDAVAIAAAVDELAGSADGVLVIPDLGSAVLSTELALELREGSVPVIVSDGPFVEAAVLAVVTAAGGAGLDAVAAAASDALSVKRGGDAPPQTTLTGIEHGTGIEDGAGTVEGAGSELRRTEVVLSNPQGLHARPAAALARTASGFAADIRVTDLATGRGPADASHLVALLALGAAGGHTLRVEAAGADAAAALDAVVALIRSGFGETA